ncbi:MAG: hypothetical protein IJU02_07430 [Lachnospiraceae bacterium]|nr:hypothetical protein [Lachnospiraceae bacterium]
MISRKITVIDTRENAIKTIDSTAETVAEMLEEFNNNGINATDMAIQEGLTRTELNESSILPHDIPYKGTVTNNLVIRLTQKEKKIKSGATTRKEIYDLIKDKHLEEAIKLEFNRNYTQVPTRDLEKFVSANITEVNAEQESKCDIVKAFTTLIDVLRTYDILDYDDVTHIKGLLIGKNTQSQNSPFDYNELEEMFKGME